MTKSYKRLEKYLFDRSKILLSRSTAVKSLIKLSTSKHCTNGWNDICNQNSKSISQLINMVFQSNSTQILNEGEEFNIQPYICMRKSFLRWNLHGKKAVFDGKYDTILPWWGYGNVGDHICNDIPQRLAGMIK